MTFATVQDGRLTVGAITAAEIPALLRRCADDVRVDSCAVYDGTTQVTKWRRT